MEIRYNEFVAELSRRSLANYEHIKERAEDDKLFEVTQLINSMYCMIVVPEEIFGTKRGERNIPKFGTKEKNLKKYHDEYKSVIDILEKLRRLNRLKYVTVDEYVQYSPVSAFINSLRNALCHDGIGFLPIQTEYRGKLKNKITDVIFESRSLDSKNVTFIAVIDVQTLEDLLKAISSLYWKVEMGKEGSNSNEYMKFYRELEGHVKDYLPDFRRYSNN